MNILSVLAVAAGAALGALVRWWLSVSLNSLFPDIPPGTLTANLAGGYIIGLVIPWFADMPTLAPETRLFVITGFLGGLTTMSSFAAETVSLLRTGRLGMGLGELVLHVGGSLTMCTLGIITAEKVLRR